MTERLYYLDPYLKEFTGKVVKTTDSGVVLDRTVFFPTGGGQPCDLGTLNGVDVTDVIEDGEDVVHVVSSPVEGAVRGVIDWDRRRDHMQQHHGQHLLSAAFIEVADAHTVSFHLGQKTCSIDLKKPVSAGDLERAETLANMIVFEGRPVQIAFYSAEEAKNLPLRTPPPEQARVRIVTVPEFESQACCGTHPRSTSEVGVISVTDVERVKGGCRVHFVCGFRALGEARKNVRVLKSLGAKLSGGRDNLEKAVDKMQADATAARRQLAAAERKLSAQIAEELAARGNVIVETFADRGIEYLRGVATSIAAKPGKVAILAGTGEASSLVIARSQDVDLDLRPLFKEVLPLIQGKGGGPAHFVQGGGPGKDIAAALKAAEGKIRANLGA